MIVCSRCGEVLKSGWDYRWHFDQHLEEFDNAEDKQEYIERTTKIVNDKLINNMSKNSNKAQYTQLMEWLPNAFKTRVKRKQRKQSRMEYMGQKRNG